MSYEYENYMDERWAVYIHEKKYYISRFLDSPTGAKEIDHFWASDKKEALVKGDIIIQSHKAGKYDHQSTSVDDR